uniref:61st family glycoside hydrolase n=1 Tax=Thermoascus aurantiacus var. levisporus TaxID=306553 RepID=S4VNV7_THEAU|nr:61st family glycoside hydrolase [Thermoascus aurantiacus var. levisporus]QDK56835.1 AA9 [synthetic construct]
MSFSKIIATAGVLASASLVAGHGFVQNIVIDGKKYVIARRNQYPYMSNPPEVIAWSTTATDLGFVDGTGYQTPDIICHRGAKPGALTAPVSPGGTVELQWTPWPDSHHGPVINYLAPCNGDCSTVDKTQLEFFKIAESGLINDDNPPGIWASDNLIAANNSWTVTIPTTIAPGNYVLRHEIIALHSAQNQDGAQNYPQCINLQVTGGGSDNPAGTLGTALYHDTDPGTLINIYQKLSSYIIPGPPLYTG